MSQETNSAPVTENKMGTMPIGKLVFNMSLPMMISMLVQGSIQHRRQYFRCKTV
nr:hypothetical protein [Agathobacter rectalis]